MKKIIALFAVCGLAAVAAYADDCGCASMDVTCVNNCTLSKISNLRKNVQAQKAAAAKKVKAVKAQQQAAPRLKKKN